MSSNLNSKLPSTPRALIWRAAVVHHHIGALMQHAVKMGDLQFLESNSTAMRNAGVHLPHLDQRVNLLNYIRIADDITVNVRDSEGSSNTHRNRKTQILDWGCGYGQMTWLLNRRDLSVTSFDIGPPDSTLPNIPLCRDLTVVRSTHPTDLPFPDNSFDAVLSCGVLEHVDECSGIPGSELKSLWEIARVLRPNGKFLIYQLPQDWAWQEAVVRRFKLGYAHPRRYTEFEIAAILKSAGFSISVVRRANFVPKNLTGFPPAFRRTYSRFSRVLMQLDRLMCKIPLVNRVAGVLEIVAVKDNDTHAGRPHRISP